jgi:P-type Ca2+ transporter type 2C
MTHSMSKTKIPSGLTSAEAQIALANHGFNELARKREWTALAVFLRQFKSVIVWILIVAAVISYAIHETVNFWAICASLGFVVLLGFVQEFRAERAMDALKRIVRPMASVIRDGVLTNLEARLIVPGDLLSLRVGDSIPADAAVLEEESLQTDESMLTGESGVVAKKRSDSLFAGTSVTRGRCLALVTATGMKTKLGAIASLIQQVEEPTPLQIRMDHLGKVLSAAAAAASVLVFIVGLFRGATVPHMLIVALALLIAAVPEGLPLAMTLCLAFGMKDMARKNAILRRMMGVETLGSVTVICTDKTGTLTQNEMTVQRVYAGGQMVAVSGTGYKPEGGFKINGKTTSKISEAANLLCVAALCNNSNLVERKRGVWEPVGDPTEVALLTLAAKGGFKKATLDRTAPRVKEILFTSSRKRMTTIHRLKDGFWVATKGALEEVLPVCTHIERNGAVERITPADLSLILKANEQLTRKALRVLAFAMKKTDGADIPPTAERGLVFLGLAGMSDPPRPEVRDAIQTCHKAGIKVLMITGDNEGTALAIAEDIGLMDGREKRVILGKALDSMSDQELEKALRSTRVFARTFPEHKIRIVSALKNMGHIVAMTGDGVNDAPALKKADIGIAMGIKGTDVAKESAEMILQDDNFATIVEAVRHGRLIFQNIEKFTAYLISRNFTEVILIFLGILFFGFQALPLLAVQILFINVFDDEMPAVALGLDKANEDLMARKPRDPDEPLLNRGNSFLVFTMAGVMSLIAFGVFAFSGPLTNIDHARTMAFITAVCLILFNTLNFRSLRESVFKIGFFDNRFLVFAELAILGVTFMLDEIPAVRGIFQLTPLSLGDWLLCFGAASLAMVTMEIAKLLRRKFYF